MKNLSLPKPLILVLVGLPGAGKSFFARQFAEMFGSPLVSFDRIRYELFAEPQNSAEEHTIIGRLAEYQIAELIKTHRSFLVDGGYNAAAARQALATYAKKHGYGVLVIWVQTDDQTAQLRSMKRNPRKLDDQFSPSLDNQTFLSLSKRLTAPSREEYVVISGKHTFSTQAKMVLRKLATPHVSEAQTAHAEDLAAERQRASAANAPSRPTPPSRGRSLIIS